MKRISQLDGVRGVAILLVLVYHYFTCQIVAEPGTLFSYLNCATSLTWSGVDLFFVLSGFLIAGILLDHHNTANYFRVFYLRRACRILPLHFLVLGLFICLLATPMAVSPRFEWVFGHAFPLVSYATFTQNIFMGIRGDFGPHWLGVTWSLAVEEQFYLFVPLLIYLLPRRVLFCVLLAGVLMAPLLRYVSPGFHAYVNTPWHADTLLSGACLAMLARSHFFVTTVQRYKGILLGLFLILLAVVAFRATRPASLGALEQCWLAGLYVSFVLIAFVDTQPLIGRVLRLPALMWFGQRSYGIYMFHEAISGLCHGWLRRAVPQIQAPSDAAVTVLALFVTLVLAELSFRLFENPILEFGHKVRYRPKGEKESALHSVTERA